MEQPPQDTPAPAPRRGARRLLSAAGVLVLVAVVAALAYERWKPSPLPRNFAVVEPERLYRSAQPLGAQFEYLIKQYGIRTFLNLRNPDKDPQYVDDEKYAAPYGARVVRLPISSVYPLDAQQLATLRNVYDDPRNYPILVHCEEGHARSGVAVAIWRIEEQGWAPDRAVEDMIESGYHVHDKNLEMRELLLHWKAPDKP
jgi:protein tyrosine/serine phosphatase